MSVNTLVVPVLSPSGTVHFASIPRDATVKDLINVLQKSDDVREDILNGLPESGWDLQKVRLEEPGRAWEDHELEILNNGKSF